MPRDPLGWAKGTAGIDVRTNRGLAFTPAGGPECPPLGGYAPAASPTGPSLLDAPPIRLLFPPRVEKLAASRDFNVNTFQLALAAVAGATVTSPLLGFQVPKDQVGWLQNMSIYVLAPTALTVVQYTVRINGAPIDGFANLQNSPGILTEYREFINEMRVRLPMGCFVDMLITNLTAAGPWVVGGNLSGWYHPLVAEQRAWGIDP